MKLRIGFAAILLLLPAVLRAQSVTTGITPDTIRVGDPVRVVLRIDDVPATTEIVLPDTLAGTDDVENAGRLRIRRDTLPGGRARLTAVYPIVLWRPGTTSLPTLPMIVRADGNERRVQVNLPEVTVTSVLPPDTSQIEARPPKDVWGADRIWWPWILGAVLALIAAALLYWWYRKRRKEVVEQASVVVIDPRERALQEIARIRALGLIEQKQFRQHYILLTQVAREFAERMEPAWSTDLTTEELAPRMKQRKEAHALLAMLRNADMVKFAKQQPTPAQADSDLATAEAFIREFNKPEPVVTPEAA